MDATPTQSTGSGTWIWHKPLTRDVMDCAQFATATATPAPDARGERIAESEEALRKIRIIAENRLCLSIAIIVDAVLMPPPERDMAVTVEEFAA